MSYGSGGDFNQGGGQYGGGQYGPPGQGPYGNPYAPPGKPGFGPGPMPPGSVKNYLVESILLLICCAGIWAIPAIVYAAQVNGKLQMGDYQGAVASSENAKKWCLIALAIGLVCQVGGMIIWVLLMAAGGMQQQQQF